MKRGVDDYEGDIPETPQESSKMQKIAKLLELSALKDEYPTVFINSVLKYLTIYELQNLYQSLSNDMRQWWDANDVWRQLCVINMKEEVQTYESYVTHLLYDIITKERRKLQYKWLLFLWDCVTALTKENTDITVIKFLIKQRQKEPNQFELPETLLALDVYVKDDDDLEMKVEETLDTPQYATLFYYCLGGISGNVKYVRQEIQAFFGCIRNRTIKCRGLQHFVAVFYWIFQSGKYIKRIDKQEHGVDKNYPLIRHQALNETFCKDYF